MISAQPVTNYPEQYLSNTCKATTEIVMSKKENLVDFLSTYSIVSEIPNITNGITLSNTAIFRASRVDRTAEQASFTSVFDLIEIANDLFSHSRPLTGEYMDLLDIAFHNSLSKTPYEI